MIAHVPQLIMKITKKGQKIMNFEDMMKMFQMMSAFSTVMQNWTKADQQKQTDNEPAKKESKKDKKDKKDMTAEERLEALESMYAKQDEEDELIKRIEALEKRAPKVTTDMPSPIGLDGILKGMIPGMMDGQVENKEDK